MQISKKQFKIICLISLIGVLVFLVALNCGTRKAIDNATDTAAIIRPNPILAAISTPAFLSEDTTTVVIVPSPSPEPTPSIEAGTLVPTVEEIVNNAFGDDELFCLAVVVCQEVGNGRDAENVDRAELIRWSVANTVINQCEHYDLTIREVCKRPRNWGTLAWDEIGFSYNNVLRVLDRDAVRQMVMDAYQSAWDVLYGGVRVLPEEVVFCAEFTQGAGCYAILYNQAKVPTYFCYGSNMAPWS